MLGVRYRVQREPSDFREFVRLAVFYLEPIYPHLEVEGEPMRFCPVIFPMDIPEAEKFAVENIRAIFFRNFLLQCPFHCVMQFQGAAAWVPCTVFIPACGAAPAE